MRRNSRNGGMVKRRNGGTAERSNGGMEEWRNGGIRGTIDSGGMAGWRDGRNRYLPTSFMVHADDDTDTFKSFIV